MSSVECSPLIFLIQCAISRCILYFGVKSLNTVTVHDDEGADLSF